MNYACLCVDGACLFLCVFINVVRQRVKFQIIHTSGDDDDEEVKLLLSHYVCTAEI